VKFENDTAIQKAMRYFSSISLAKIVLCYPEMEDVFKRNMNQGCWNVIHEYLADRDFCEAPEKALDRFEKEYQRRI
jgi:hypothetical protein